MKRLAKTSFYFKNMMQKIEDYVGNCQHSISIMKKNKVGDLLPPRETRWAYEQIHADVGMVPDTKENFLVMACRRSGYVWIRSLGRNTTGTSAVIIKALQDTLLSNIHMCKEFYMDNAANLNSEEVQQFAKND